MKNTLYFLTPLWQIIEQLVQNRAPNTLLLKQVKSKRCDGWNSCRRRFQKFCISLQYVHLLAAQVFSYFYIFVFLQCFALHYVRECLALQLLVAEVVPETDVFAVNIRHGTPYGRQLWIGFFAP